MVPILSTDFPVVGNGLGGLPDCLECVVTHEINGIYELMLKYPLTGVNFSQIYPNAIIMAKPDNSTGAQPFRIYRITKPLNGIVTIYARHLSYDMSGIIVEPFLAMSLSQALTRAAANCTPSCPFTLATTRTVASSFMLSTPRPLWKLMGGEEGSLLDRYGGEWDFDGLTATLKNELGQDRGVEIRYGKNLTELEQDATLEATYSGVYPFWANESTDELVTLTEKFISIPGSVVHNRLLILDCSGDFEEAPTESELRDHTNAYISRNSLGVRKVSWKVSFVSLAQAGEYETQALLEEVRLGDTLSVFYEALDINAKSRVVKTEFDCLNEKYKAVTIGRVKQNLADIIVEQSDEIENAGKDLVNTRDALDKAQKDATYSITHGGGQFRFVYDSDNNVVEILSMDDPRIDYATNVWRWNGGGFGFSPNGYNGPYTLALLPTGEIVADFITTGTLTANVIRAGIIQDILGLNSWDLETGELTITNGTIHITTNSASQDIIVLSYSDYMTTVTPDSFVVEDDATYKATFVKADGVQVMQEHAPGAYDTLGVDLSDTGLKLYDSDERLRGELDLTNGLTFYNANGSVAAQYPAIYQNRTSFGTVSPYSSRITVDAGGFYRWGTTCFVNMTFTGATSSSSGPRIGGSLPNAAMQSPLLCIDVTNGASGSEIIPCFVDTSGRLYVKTLTNGHSYILSGQYTL